MTPDQMDKIMTDSLAQHKATWEPNPAISDLANAIVSFDTLTRLQVNNLLAAGVTDEDVENYEKERGRLGAPAPAKEQS